MKNRIGLAAALAISMVSCNQSSDKVVTEADQQLKQAEQELKTAQINKDKAAKAKAVAEWNAFKKESDSLIFHAGSELGKLQAELTKASKKDGEKLRADYEKAKSDLALLKENLHERNVAFEKDVKKFDQQVNEKNESFKREFKHDMDELKRSLEDLFKDNVK